MVSALMIPKSRWLASKSKIKKAMIVFFCASYSFIYCPLARQERQSRETDTTGEPILMLCYYPVPPSAGYFP